MFRSALPVVMTVVKTVPVDADNKRTAYEEDVSQCVARLVHHEQHLMHHCCMIDVDADILLYD